MNFKNKYISPIYFNYNNSRILNIPILVVYSKKELLSNKITEFIGKIKCNYLKIRSSKHAYCMLPFSKDIYIKKICDWIQN